MPIEGLPQNQGASARTKDRPVSATRDIPTSDIATGDIPVSGVATGDIPVSNVPPALKPASSVKDTQSGTKTLQGCMKNSNLKKNI